MTTFGRTDSGAPAGKKYSPAETLAVYLLHSCRTQGATTQYGTFSHSSAMQLLKDLLHPEELGHAVTAEV